MKRKFCEWIWKDCAFGLAFGLGGSQKMMGSIPLDLAIVCIYRRAAAIIAIVLITSYRNGNLYQICYEKSFLGTQLKYCTLVK
jgi:hypothetical protein